MKSQLRAALLSHPPEIYPETPPRLREVIEAIAYAKKLLADGEITPSEFEIAVDTALEWLP